MFPNKVKKYSAQISGSVLGWHKILMTIPLIHKKFSTKNTLIARFVSEVSEAVT